MNPVYEQREFRADPLKLKRLRVSAGLTIKDFAAKADLDRGTAAKMLRGDPVYLRTLADAGQKAFGIPSPLELLHPDELAQLGVASPDTSCRNVLEWEIIEILTPWIKTSNGLQYQLVKLKHRYLDGRFARAKRYELRHLATSDRQQLEQHLRRHVEVCELVGCHPNVAQNLTAALLDGLWWILDAWHDGTYLCDRLAKGALSEYELKFIMTGIASGLDALHSHRILMRELAPQRVLIRQSDDRPILTDLELAKLTENVPSVSPQHWPDDPYRALEVNGQSPIDERADIYSFARIFYHAALGELPARGKEDACALPVPRKLIDLLTESLSVGRSGRPGSIKPMLAALRDWP